MMENTLYYGDNLDVLRRHIKDESVDLIYLDPPFNSNATYNVLFAEKNGSKAASQIKAFDDTWHWNQESALAYEEIVEGGGKVADAMMAFRTLLGENDMMAYLSMMAPRLVELRRVLKATGSIYLHCDPTASHYLKLLMDSVFGIENFRNDITWKRSDAHNDARKQFGMTSDHIYFYSRSRKAMFHRQHCGYKEKTLRDWYQYLEFRDGTIRRMTKVERETQKIPFGTRRFNTGDLRSPNPRPNLMYEYKGYKPHRNGWAVSFEKMCELDEKGLLIFPSNREGRIMRKRYLDEQPGAVVGDVWTDISQIRGADAELLGYPTQKPVALLERIIQASSNEGDIVLDPFCGCGTTIDAAQRLNRNWIGIDITHLAITLIKHRLKSAYGDDVQFQVVGEPVDLASAETLAKEDPYQFQFWSLGLVGARPMEEKKGADRGIDGRIYFHDEKGGKTKQIIISVKAGKVQVSHVRDLRGVIDREKAEIGVLISMNDPTREMEREAATGGFYDSPWGRKHPRLQILTVKQLLEGRKIDYPGRGVADSTFKGAQRVRKEAKEKQGEMF